ncbi:MAG: zinc-binding dehydrogenase, partial [Bacteroidota bacterium]
SVGSANKLDLLQREGYDAAIVRGKDFAERLEEKLDGRELSLIMECIGGKIFQIGYDQLAPQGRMVVYGSARYASPGDRPNYFKLFYQFLTRPKIDPQKMIETNKAILGFNLIWLYEKAPLMHQIIEEMSALQIAKPLVGHTFAFAKLPEAIRLFRSGKTMGKVVVQVND